MSTLSFKRVEKKYKVTGAQREILEKAFLEHMKYDKVCQNHSSYSVRNIYFDTEQNETISISVQKPTYKQKLRARKYEGQDTVFLEIKKKIDGVVAKRRVILSNEEMADFVLKGIKPVREKYVDKMVIEEIAYMLKYYNLKPYAFVGCYRLGYVDLENPDFRITFDEKVHARSQKDFNWEMDYQGDQNLLPEDTYLMEIKHSSNYPLWLCKLLSENKIYPTSFSKIGTYYLSQVSKNRCAK